MDLTRVDDVVDGIPFMKPAQAQVISALIIDSGAKDVLELGVLHGVSTCYLAETLSRSGRDWSITAIDRRSAAELSPNAETLLGRLGLADRVTLHYEPTSYIWRLRTMLAEDPEPRFDFCYLDGAHNWETDGFAFFLVDRLLRPGGWIVFDDIAWSYATSPALRETEQVLAMPAEEREAQQIRDVFELLVKAHPSYGEFAVRDGWGFARKLESATGTAALRREIVTQQVGLGAVARQAYRKMKRRLGR